VADGARENGGRVSVSSEDSDSRTDPPSPMADPEIPDQVFKRLMRDIPPKWELLPYL
jgi:hypothetical protein